MTRTAPNPATAELLREAWRDGNLHLAYRILTELPPAVRDRIRRRLLAELRVPDADIDALTADGAQESPVVYLSDLPAPSDALWQRSEAGDR